jgi:hypothetical protein
MQYCMQQDEERQQFAQSANQTAVKAGNFLSQGSNLPRIAGG